jgi:hypothetical protein
MNPELQTNFLTNYIRSLSEESRTEMRGDRYGFDRVIHELALADELIPVRLSFYRQGDDEISSPKKEAEHGVDQSFITRDGKQLFVFVLKDEVLSYRNWIEEKFESDLRRARDQDLTVPELVRVEDVCIVLGYNKDENEEGVESFDKFVKASPTKIGDKATLRFERWNLTTITEKVRQKLLAPSLLPENFFRRFTYLCWQVGDFAHGSPQWREVLIPDWREFLSSVLKSPVSERNIRLISVALIVLRSHGKQRGDGTPEPSFETGWLELVEWAVLSVWDVARKSDDKGVQQAAMEIWLNFYLVELENFYTKNIDFLATEHSLEIGGMALQEAASAYLAYWHLGRLGVFAMAVNEFSIIKADQSKAVVNELQPRIIEWIIRLLNANPSCQRPLLDIHHIEIFLVWRALMTCGRVNDVLGWFQTLFERLLFRRLGKAGCRVIDSGNSWESLFEYLATGEEPHGGFGKSSYLLLMILELLIGTPNQQGEELAVVIHHQLIQGKNEGGPKLPFKEQLELMGWVPPNNWGERILREGVTDGICMPVHFTGGEGDLALPRTLKKFIDRSRQEYPFNWPLGAPPSALVLACIKHISPLPSEFWRVGLFGQVIEKDQVKFEAGTAKA